MKILWVKAERLFPVHNGGNIRSYHIARSLTQAHDVTFLSYYGGSRDAGYEAELRRHFPHAVCVCTGASKTSAVRRALDYLFHLPARAPYAVSRFASAVVQEQLAVWFQQQAFDVAVCDFLDAAINFPQRLTMPTVLFQHNVESEIWRRHSEASSNIGMRPVYKLEAQKMLRYEESVVRRFHHVIAVSEHDRKLMSRWVDPQRITVVPTGVDLESFHPCAQSSGKPLVLFVGAMDWEPNVDAVEYFCAQVWPEVKKAVPAAEFRIVGRNPGRRVLRLTSDSVSVTGSVTSVQTHLEEAAVVVVPLRIGGGTRLKIYEAMAMGKAVVSTSVGAEGLDVHDGRDIVLADEPGAFAQAVKILLQDAELRRRYGRAAIDLARRYDWPEISRQFAEVLEETAGAKRKLAEANAPHMQETAALGGFYGERGR